MPTQTRAINPEVEIDHVAAEDAVDGDIDSTMDGAAGAIDPFVRTSVGTMVGDSVGGVVGAFVGDVVGAFVGYVVGDTLDKEDGEDVVRESVGRFVGNVLNGDTTEG